ncbi:MAG: hypothetical protein ACLFWL_00150 [Candidatus Brocadiia bacterium]
MSLDFETKLPDDQAPLYGILEWQCWYGHYDIIDFDPETVVDECIDAHLNVGFNHLVWNAGRSTIDYHSDLPNTTLMRHVEGPDENAAGVVARAVFNVQCPLRRALERCRKENVPFIARLCMNRHYGADRRPEITSRFAAEHPEYQERDRAGNTITSKLCYAIAHVRQERIDILLELQRIGVDALLLDFCRQMPHLRYHDELVDPFVEQTGTDPREINSADPDDFRHWYRYRAEIMTGFMRKLRSEVRAQEKELQKKCPIIARVPDGSEWLMLAYGLDLPRWFSEDLIDATMLSPFPITKQDLKRHFREHAELAHEHGKDCIGGLGSMGLFQHNNMSRRRDIEYKPKHAYELLAQQYDAGVDSISIYQTETLARMGYLQDLMLEAGTPETVIGRADELPGKSRSDTSPVGVDWHSFPNGLYGVGTSVEAQQSL